MGLNPAHLIDKYINTSYDDIKLVVDNIVAIVNAGISAASHQVASSDPTVRADGSTLQAGDTYFNTQTSIKYTYSIGLTWIIGDGGPYLLDTTDTLTGDLTITNSVFIGVNAHQVIDTSVSEITIQTASATDSELILRGTTFVHGRLAASTSRVALEDNFGNLLIQGLHGSNTTIHSAGGGVFLTSDTSQNSTFAGDLTVTGLVSADTLTVAADVQFDSQTIVWKGVSSNWYPSWYTMMDMSNAAAFGVFHSGIIVDLVSSVNAYYSASAFNWVSKNVGNSSLVTQGNQQFAYYTSAASASGADEVINFFPALFLVTDSEFRVSSTDAYFSGHLHAQSTFTATGQINAPAGTTAIASLNIAEGVTKTTPVDGDVHITAAGAFNVHLNGTTVDLAAGGGGIGGSITDNQIALGALAAGDIEGSATLTYDGSRILVGGATNAIMQLDSGNTTAQQWVEFVDTDGIGARLLHSSSGQFFDMTILAANFTTVAAVLRAGQLDASSRGYVTIDVGGSNGVTAQEVVTFSGLGATDAEADFKGLVLVPASTTTQASARIPHGAAPTSPIDGDMWTTTAGLYVRINGTTVGPLS